MEILFLELNVFITSIILACVVFLSYIHWWKSFINLDALEKFVVIDFVRFLKKTCPVQLSNKWKLLSIPSCSSRVWYKTVLLPGFKNYIKLYGATCAVTCSSLYAFSLISDVSKWGEWQPSHSSAQNFMLQSFTNNELKRDHFMQADQVADIQRGTDIQSYAAMYRFLSPPTKCKKWILFWNAKNFEFLFFLIQPVASRNAENQCVITHLHASCFSSPHNSTSVSQRIRNIHEFLIMSQLDVMPFKHSVIPVKASNKKDFSSTEDPTSTCSETQNCDKSNSVFILKPAFHQQKYFFGKLKGFDLVLKKAIVKPHTKKSKIKVNNVEKENVHKILRRTASDFSISTKTDKEFYGSNLQTNLDKSNISVLKSNHIMNKSLSNVISGEGDVFAKDESVSQDYSKQTRSEIPRLKLRSISEPAVAPLERSKSSFEITSDNKSLDSIHELDESTNTAGSENNEIVCSSTSDFEVIDSANQQFIDITLASYLTQGNYGASVLQTEMMLASQFDKTIFTGNRVAGGWIHTSTYKGIPVFTKSISGKIMKISSFLCQMEVPVNSKIAWKFVKNPRFRFFCDESVKTVQIRDKISDSQKIIHTYHETTGVIKKEAVDFCLLQTEREEKNSFYSVFQSIESEKCPFMHSVTRGSLKPSGWIVQSLAPKSCKVTYLIQIFVSSPYSLFIQELNYLVPQTLYNLKQYFLSELK